MHPTIVHDPWPALPLEEWRDTYATLHRWVQMVGKTRLALAPMQNHWWQVVLYVTSRGLSTSPMPVGDRTFEIELDFLDHQLLMSTSDGETRRLALERKSVADFYSEYMATMRELDIAPRIYTSPVEIADATPFREDRAHASYDADAAQRCWRVLSSADRLLKEFRGRFIGKSSPSHFFWGGFDLACTRFSGRRAPPYASHIPNCPDYVMLEAYSHEVISAGWWPGSIGSPVEDAAFYAYAYPEPPGCPDAPIRPAEASYNSAMREWILPYEAVRKVADPKAAVLDFLQSTYEAAATRGGWNRAELERQ
jgi:Family of unknown function (DUF5996)